MEAQQPPPQTPPADSFPEVDALLRAATPRVWVTPLIAGLLVACYLGSVVLGADAVSPTAAQLLKLGASFGPLIVEGEWWRLLTAGLLHGGLVHLAFNLWAFWSAGFLTERLFGNAGFLLIYLLSAVGAGLVSVTLKPLGVSVGASGAIFGVYGALLAFVLTHRGVLPRAFLLRHRAGLLGFLVYNLLYSVADRRVDLGGHLGGLLTGMAAGWLLQRDLLQPRANEGRRWMGAVGLALLLLVGAFGARARVLRMPEVRASELADRAEEALNAHQPARAIELATQSLALHRYAGALAIRGIARLRMEQPEEAVGDLRDALELEEFPPARDALCHATALASGKDSSRIESAIAECTRAVEKSRDPAYPLFQRAWLRSMQDKEDEALADLKLALERSPRDPDSLQLRATLYMDGKRLDDAEKDCAVLDGAEAGSYRPGAACAEVARRRGDDGLAVKRATFALQRRPEHLGSLMVRATTLSSQGDFPGALADLDRAVRVAPSDAEVLNERAWIRVAHGDFAGAREDADRALASRPHWPLALGSRCFALLGLGERAAARRDCEESVKLSPDDPLDRGMVAFLHGRNAEALQLWKGARQSRANAAALAPWIAQASGR